MIQKNQRSFWKSILLHSGFWALSFVTLYRLFTLGQTIGEIDLYYTIMFHIPLFIIVYLNFYLIDTFIDNKKYTFYVIGFLFLFALGVLLHYGVFDYLTDFIFPEFFIVSMSSVVQISQFIFVYLIVSLLFKLSKDWFQLKANQMSLQKENHQSQITFLKAQLNPHFLFNSLNNIYALTSTDVKKGRENIIKLSDALRYMLYKTDVDRVPLESELEYLKNYVELEKLRLESDEEILVDLDENLNAQKIAPLILLPFIENCFKHCNKENPEIDIKVDVEDQTLKLVCKNNKSEKEKGSDGGVGLANAKKRLELIYKGNYDLKIEELNAYYKTQLILDLDA